MITYVDKNSEMRAEFDLVIDRCEISDLSSSDIIEEALILEKRLADNN